MLKIRGRYLNSAYGVPEYEDDGNTRQGETVASHHLRHVLLEEDGGGVGENSLVRPGQRHPAAVVTNTFLHNSPYYL